MTMFGTAGSPYMETTVPYKVTQAFADGLKMAPQSGENSFIGKYIGNSFTGNLCGEIGKYTACML